MVDALAGLADDDSLHPEALAQVVEQLLRCAPEIGREAALAVVEGVGTRQAATGRALAAARVLLLEDVDASWHEVWESLTQHPDQADEVVRGIAVTLGLEAGRVTARLGTPELVALCEWLVDRFPPAEAPDAEWVASPRYLTALDSVEDMRRTALNELAGRGTPGACSALERMSAGHPDDGRLRHLARIARSVLRALSWIAPSPAELLGMVASRQVRWVESANHLLRPRAGGAGHIPGEAPSRVLGRGGALGPGPRGQLEPPSRRPTSGAPFTVAGAAGTETGRDHDGWNGRRSTL